MGLQSEHYYTGEGRQRAVFLDSYTASGRFALDVMESDDAAVEVSLASKSEIRKGRANWQLYEGGLGGSLEGISAIRVHVKRCEGWVKLTVWGDENGTA